MARKRVEKTVDIDADAATVWKAISDGEELKRWFPLDARVTPGEGGKVWLSFGEGSEWESPIEVWKPNEHLRTVDEMPSGEGKPPLKIAVDYIIEARAGGTTTLRLIHSGFADDAWEDEIESLDNGWSSFLANLAHYLHRHRGEPREMAFFRHPVVPLTREEAFRRTMNALGFSEGEMRLLRVGGRYGSTTARGDRIEGEVKVFAPPGNFTATMANHGEGFLMVEMEPGRQKCRPAIWMSFYGEWRRAAAGFSRKVQAVLESAFEDVGGSPLAKGDGS